MGPPPPLSHPPLTPARPYVPWRDDAAHAILATTRGLTLLRGELPPGGSTSFHAHAAPSVYAVLTAATAVEQRLAGPALTSVTPPTQWPLTLGQVVVMEAIPPGAPPMVHAVSHLEGANGLAFLGVEVQADTLGGAEGAGAADATGAAAAAAALPAAGGSVQDPPPWVAAAVTRRPWTVVHRLHVPAAGGTLRLAASAGVRARVLLVVTTAAGAVVDVGGVVASPLSSGGYLVVHGGAGGEWRFVPPPPRPGKEACAKKAGVGGADDAIAGEGEDDVPGEGDPGPPRDGAGGRDAGEDGGGDIDSPLLLLALLVEVLAV